MPGVVAKKDHQEALQLFPDPQLVKKQRFDVKEIDMLQVLGRLYHGDGPFFPKNAAEGAQRRAGE
eukprot:768305-Hanusia_phi.AAC.3